jgi:hypothetical protein
VTASNDWTDDQLVELAALPADHPDVRAVRASPRHWARLIALRAFLHGGETPPDAREGEAVARTRETLERELFAGPNAAGADDAAAPAARHTTSRPERRTARAFPGGWRIWRPAFAVAALLVAAVWLIPEALDRRSVMRGPESSEIRTSAPDVYGDRVVFTWSAVPGADAYELRWLREDLSLVRPPLATADTAVEIPLEALFPPDGTDGRILWRVSAMRGAELIATSVTAVFERP